MLMSISAATVEGSTMVKALSTFIAVILVGRSKPRKDCRATSEIIKHASLEPLFHRSIIYKPEAKYLLVTRKRPPQVVQGKRAIKADP
jgi:hypothetical protein